MAWKEWRDGLQKIWTAPNLHGIERLVGIGVFVLKTFILTELIRLLPWNRKDKRKGLPDLYVVLVTAFLFILLVLPPSAWSVGFAIYFLASIIVYLLNVVLLSKVFGRVLSPERSLILLILNVAQVVLIFAIFYRLELREELEGWRDALVDAVLVLGTVAVPFPLKARPIAAVQVAIDFMLLAVFLAHFVGGLGRGDALEEDLPMEGVTTEKKLTNDALTLSLFAVPIVAAVIMANLTDTKEATGVYVLLVAIPWTFIAIKISSWLNAKPGPEASP